MQDNLPMKFWNLYSAELSRCQNWEIYMNDTEWTKFATKAAKNVCKELGLNFQKEYFRIDLIGYKEYSKHNWHLKIAFEHENGRSWEDELCKLSHVIADLRVIVSYHNFKNIEGPKTNILKKLNELSDRVFRYPELAWLFICGPRKISGRNPFLAYTIDNQRRLIELKSEKMIYPDIWD